MYNTQPHICTQEVNVSVKNGDEHTTWLYAAVRKSGKKIAWSLGRSTMAVTNGWPMTTRSDSLKPNHSWMHAHMALNDRTTAPSVAVWRSVHTSRLPVYHGCGGRTRGGGEEGRLVQSNAAKWTKGTEPPWSTVHHRPIYSFITPKQHHRYFGNR